MQYTDEKLKEYISSLNERLKQENFDFNIQLKYDEEFHIPYIDVTINSYPKDTRYFKNIFTVMPLTNINDVIEFIKYRIGLSEKEEKEIVDKFLNDLINKIAKIITKENKNEQTKPY